jgi:methionyl-tRNA formyltransferase
MESTDKHIKIRTVFMGTSPFAATILEAMIEQQYNIVAVYTKPDKPVGRKQKVEESAVKKIALEKGIEVLQPQKFDGEAVSKLKDLEPDILVVAAYGKILPPNALSIPGFGCINVHGSLLPKFRGPSPIQNALLCGEKETGITIMLMDNGMDTGNIISQKSLRIGPDDTADFLFDKLAKLGKSLLLETLPLWVDRKLESKAQDSSLATLCQLIDREDGRVLWEEEAQVVYDKYRALHPWPGIFTYWKNGESSVRIKLLEISLQKMTPQSHHETGEVFELGDKIAVQAINGVIVLGQVQLEGKKPVTITDFINGYPAFLGSILY